MPAYHVERSVRIDADESRVRPAIENFAEWPKWSPWLCMEPTTKLNVYGTPGKTDHGYEWDGELVGAGSMKIASTSNGTQQMDLSFLRPFKSKAQVMMQVKPAGEGQTDVTWHMDGKMPFFLFFMIGMMKSMIGMDYERGLKMLKEYVETGKVNSLTEIEGIVDVPRTHYLGIGAHCSMNDIGKSMENTMEEAHKCATDNNVEIAGPPGSLYPKVDLKNNECDYISIMQTKSPAQVAGAISGTIEPCKAIKVVHKGNYEHLGNAWGAAYSYQRGKKLKLLKSQCAFEFYPNDPRETPEEEWLTEIFVPIRG